MESLNKKVEISIVSLIEINRMINALKKDENSYIHKVFSDDYVFSMIDEIQKLYDKL